MSALSERIKAVEPSIYSDNETAIEAKIVLLGDSGTGKTSLMQRYVNDVFDQAVSTTIGAGFANKRVVINNVKIKLHIWDTAGQERFRSMAPMYYRGATAAILVYDITNQKTFQAIQGWVQGKELREAAVRDSDLRQIAIGIAGNKKDLKMERAVAEEDGLAYANSIGLGELFVGLCIRVLEGAKKGDSSPKDDPKRSRTPSKTRKESTIRIDSPRSREGLAHRKRVRTGCLL